MLCSQPRQGDVHVSESTTRAPAPGTGEPGPSLGRSQRSGVVASLAATGLGLAVTVVVYLVFVRTADGQRVDHAALGRVNAGKETNRQVAGLLNDLTIGVAICVLAGCVVVALVRHQYEFAIAAVVLVGGANLTTQLAKHELLTRPGVGYGASNSLPSGHTTLTVSLLMAVLLVLPALSRGVVVLVGSVAATVVGVGMVVAGWHRPSDVVAALGICLAWAGLVATALWLRPGATAAGRGSTYRASALAGAVVAVALTYAYGVRPDGSWRDLVVHGGTLAGIGLAAALALSIAARVLPVTRR